MKANYNDVEKISARELSVGDYFTYNETVYRCICKHADEYITGQSIDGSEEDMEYYYISLPASRDVYVGERERRWLVQEFDEDNDITSEELFTEREDAYKYMVSFVNLMGATHKEENVMTNDLQQLSIDYENGEKYLETDTYGHFRRRMVMTELTTHTGSIEYT